MSCSACRGCGYDPYVVDPMGGSLYELCSECNGTGLTKREQIRAKESKIIQALDECDKRNAS